MTTPQVTTPYLQACPAEERRAIVRAARTVFAREGWTHTTVQAVAAEAGIAQSTVEQGFRDKELLLSVLLDSSASVAATLTAVAESHLVDITDLEQDLIALGHAWLTPLTAFPEHFAIVRHLGAEIAHLPAGVVDMWQTAGPRQARGELASRLQDVADRGLLDIADADRAAERFVQLVTSDVVQRSFHGALPLSRQETDTLIADGVADFVRLYSHGNSRDTDSHRQKEEKTTCTAT